MQPFQYAIGNPLITFGRNTTIPVSKCEVQPYNVQNQDFQVERTDENRFGVDTLVPAPIIFTMAIQENYILPQFEHLYPGGLEPDDLFSLRGTLLGQLARTWKARNVRMQWGTVVPLYFCTRDGEVLRIYGRPGKFQYAPDTARADWIDIQAEFRRADTFAHTDTEYFVGSPNPATPLAGMPPGGAPLTAERGLGDADSWVRIYIQGPAVNPVITYGDQVIQTVSHLPAGVSMEISTYPWQRRFVDTNGINRRMEIVGDTLYLDQIQFMEGESIPVSWTADSGSTTSDSQMWFLWREAYNVI